MTGWRFVRFWIGFAALGACGPLILSPAIGLATSTMPVAGAAVLFALAAAAALINRWAWDWDR